MLIKVKTLTGKEIEIDIEPTDKVERIKERVEEKEGIPPPQQRLIFSGKQMNDEKTAAEYKVRGHHWTLGTCSEILVQTNPKNLFPLCLCRSKVVLFCISCWL